MVQSKKMASLGILTAGIAHEINNPVNFISSGINSLKKDFFDIQVVANEGGKLSYDEDNMYERLEKIKKITILRMHARLFLKRLKIFRQV